MIGRAGRPGFDTTAVAVVMVVEDKKSFYRRVRPIKRDVFAVRIVLTYGFALPYSVSLHPLSCGILF
jgi:hypothetical protein